VGHIIEEKLKKLGIGTNGENPWDLNIHDRRTLDAVLREQSIGAGESYMKGWWDCEKLDELFFRFCQNKGEKEFYAGWKVSLIRLRNTLINQQSRRRAAMVAKEHYNIGNKLYEKMLGKSMAYTCGFWKDAKSLDEAQFKKYDLICKKLYLQPHDKVLELGCGWGGLAKYMAENYGCEVVAIDIGTESSRYAKEACKNLPVTIYQGDYRDTHIYNSQKQKFDKIVSVGVLEHVGYKNYSIFLDIARSFIKPQGIFLLHSIGKNITLNFCDPWIDKYIFPNGILPSLKLVGKAFENRFVVEDLHNFGAYYDNTLMEWYKNLNLHWPELRHDYNEKFLRMMNYYLLSCAGVFRARNMQLWQFVLTPNGKEHGYISVR
jgi:cyclopropane-fatty-acyl-phospholipid synthase